MRRAALTVVLTNGIRLDATMVTPTWRDGDNHPMLSFICSGRMASYPLEDVAALELYRESAFCGMCEQALPDERPSVPVVVGPTPPRGATV